MIGSGLKTFLNFGNKLKEQKEQLRAEKRAERERIKQDILDKEVEIERACADDPKSKACKEGKRKKLLIF